MNRISGVGVVADYRTYRIIPDLITFNLIVTRHMMGNIALLCNREREKERKGKTKSQDVSRINERINE